MLLQLCVGVVHRGRLLVQMGLLLTLLPYCWLDTIRNNQSDEALILAGVKRGML